MIPSLKEVREALRPFAEVCAKIAPESEISTNTLRMIHVNYGIFVGSAKATGGQWKWDVFRRAAALYDSLLTAQAEANVSEIRPWDAPGFEACVKAERERLRAEKSDG